LAGQAADRQIAQAPIGLEQIIAGVVQFDRLLRVRAIDDGAHHFFSPAVRPPSSVIQIPLQAVGKWRRRFAMSDLMNIRAIARIIVPAA
jgi:hypothetical protein